MTDNKPKKLIEVAMPIKEISAESVRDKSIRHGHISTLHLWWARRPLPVCRAVVFASLVPDPLDENCPQSFRDAVDQILNKPFDLNYKKGSASNDKDWYKPYDNIPYTAALDSMEDNLRNRLLMFIGKFSSKFIANLKEGKSTAARDQLSDASLIKWDNKNNDLILNRARKLIWVAHNSNGKKSAKDLLSEFDSHYDAIKKAEKTLYGIQDRHIESNDVVKKQTELNNAIESFLEKMPKVFDPFAGGGAIPLEAARLGCKSYGNDINPVAHIIQKGSLEFPQKFGKPITYSKTEFVSKYGESFWNEQPLENKITSKGEEVGIRINNRLSFDVDFYARKLLANTEKEIGHIYPSDKKGNRPIAYYWARVAHCENPSCQAEVPLLRQFYLANTSTKKVYLNPLISGNQIDFEILSGPCHLSGWSSRGNLTCPCCGNITDVKQIKKQSINDGLKHRLLAVIFDSKKGKLYRAPSNEEIKLSSISYQIYDRPKEGMQRNSAGGDTFSWGIKEWGQMFTDRQLFTLNNFTKTLKENSIGIDSLNSDYSKSIITYLAILIDRIAVNMTSFGLWKPSGEFLSSAFGRQAIPMVFDYPESNPFCDSTGSFLNQLDWVLRYIESESAYVFTNSLENAASGEKEQFAPKFLTAVITDPPYYDAIAYADLSDFFYVWLKRTIGHVYPLNFATPQTPKSNECTALKHHHNNSIDGARIHFETKLTEIFASIEHQTSDLVSIMFAHQSTAAWTTLCNSVLGANMNITSSWPIDSERSVRSVALAGAALESSVTVSARPSSKNGVGNYKQVKAAIGIKVEKEVEDLFNLGFRGADLLTACFGQAVSEFGKYEIVEKADGSNVEVSELLQMAREAAFNALLKGFDGDDFTKFYIGWLQLYGFTESDFDDAAKFSRVGLSINVQELFDAHILIKSGNKQTLGGFKERLEENKNLGYKSDALLIDQVHQAMNLYQGTNHKELLEFIAKWGDNPDNSFWRVINSVCEVLPAGSEDLKHATGLLASKDSLIRESKNVQTVVAEQPKLFE